MIALTLLLTGCLELEPPPPPPPPPGATERKEISMIPPGAAPDGDTPNAAPRIRTIDLTPSRPTTRDPVQVRATAEDVDQDHLDTDYLWIINGQDRPDLSTSLLGSDHFDKGDKLQVRVTVSDGETEVEQLSGEITVINSAPEFVGDPRATGQLDGMTLRAEDPDDDELRFSISGAPAGMSIDREGGRIEYKGTEEEEGGAYQITITVDDGDGGTAQWSFEVEVSPGSVAVQAKKKAEEEAAKAKEEGR